MTLSSPKLRAAEFSRFANRRAIRNVLMAVLIVYVVGTIAMFVYFTPATRAEADRARATNATTLAEATRGYQDCVRTLAPGHRVLDDCGTDPAGLDPDDFTQYLSAQPFVLQVTMPRLALYLGFGFAVVAFMIGATWIGAEWTTGSLPMLATWESSRVRLLGTKAVVLAIATGVVALVLQAAWLLTSQLLAQSRGVEGPDPVAWSHLFGLQLRLVVLAMVAALVGFAVASLARSTAAAVGVAFGYALVVEGAVRWIAPGSQRWLVSDNVRAFTQSRRFSFTWTDAGTLTVTRISHTHAGLTMAVAAALLLTVSVLVFRRSDLG